MSRYLTACQKRLDAARRCAETCLGDERAHRLAMEAVFRLEDCYELLVIIERKNKEGRGC